MRRLAYKPKLPKIDKSVFNDQVDWKEFYGLVEEKLPANMSEPHRLPVIIPAFVDTNHAGNIITM